MALSVDETECAVISDDEEILKRLSGLGRDFHFKVITYDGLDDFMSEERSSRIVVVGSNKNNIVQISKEITELAQGVAHHCPNAYKVAILEKKLESKDHVFLAKSGIDFVTYKRDISMTSRLDFFIIQKIKAEFFPIKHRDIAADVTLPFDMYYLLPKNKKYLCAVREGGSFEEKKTAKHEEMGELYVHRSQVDQFVKFAKELAGFSEGDPLRGHRMKLLDYYVKYSDFILSQTDAVQNQSFGSGKELLARYEELADDIIKNFSELSLDDIVSVINRSQVGEFGSVERAPGQAIFCSYFASKCNMENVRDLVLVTLLVPFGLLSIPHSVNQKIRKGKMNDFDYDEKSYYRNFPLKSIEVILNQKVPIKEAMRELISTALECADGSGIPNGRKGESLSMESQVVGFSIYFDSKIAIELGEVRLSAKEVLNQILADGNTSRFTHVFMGELKRALRSGANAGGGREERVGFLGAGTERAQ